MRIEAAEERLAPMTDRLKAWAGTVTGLRTALDGPPDIDRMADRVEHDLIPYRDQQVHLEIHTASGEGGPAIVFSPGIGGYARFYLPVLGKLCDAGFNVVGVDRPGHGLSEGRRGDCTIDQVLDVLESAVRYARRRFGGPVVLMGSSLGGIITWYALTREPDVDAAVCHNVTHPAMPHERAARLKIPVLKRLARVAPYAPVPIKQVADFEAVADSREMLDYFRGSVDPLWCRNLTARSVASIFEYSPPIEWAQVETPALVLVGRDDRMVTPAFTERVLEAGRPKGAELRVLDGAGHMLFFDDLDRSVALVSGWLGDKLAAEPRPAPARAA